MAVCAVRARRRATPVSLSSCSRWLVESRYGDSIAPTSSNVLYRPNSDATPRSIAPEPILRTFSQQLDGIQELQQVSEIECLVVPHAHMAPIRTDRRGGVWDESRHLFHVPGIHLVVASTNSKRLYFDLM